MSGLLRVGGTDEGLSLSVEPEYGEAAGGGERLWSEGVAAAAEASEPAARLSTELGYGLALGGGPLVTPYGGLDLSGGERSYRLGSRLTIAGGFDLELQGTRREAAAAEPVYELELSGTLSW